MGVAHGHHAESLLKTLNIDRLYLIDPYQMYADYSEGHEVYGVTQPELSRAKTEAEERLAPFKDRIEWVSAPSAEASLILHGLQFDFVYLDGNHDYDYVMHDLRSWSPMLTSSNGAGVIGGHDFYNGYRATHDGVVKAVTEWCVANAFELKVELPDWWVQMPEAGNRVGA